MARTLDLSPLFRHTIGFDRLDELFQAALREGAQEGGYPPYNILKTGEHSYRITLAVAGFTLDDLEVVSQADLLVVRGRSGESDKELHYLHRGIARRAFELRFQLADHVRVDAARLVNGLLDVELVREVPEAAKPRAIAIQTPAAKGAR